jgi:tRNA pseudouridine synthase 10
MACKGTGRLVPESVAEFVCAPLREALDGRTAEFNGSGREDVDVRMLGDGRPFTVKIDHPLRRSFDAAAIASRVAELSRGRVVVGHLRCVDRRERGRITNQHAAKVYRVVVRADDGAALPDDAPDRVRALAGAELAQRTPRRVALRRAALVRARRILAIDARCAAGGLVLEVGTEPGTYVKEFVSGDGGRTSPSVASVLGLPVTCVELDVVAVGGV